MINEFVLKVILSFVIAGSWIATATLLAERLGSKVGGLLANLPSNILISLLFIGLTQSVSFAAEASRAAPIGMLIDSIFLFVFILALKKGLKPAVVASLATWFGLALIAGTLQYDNMIVGIVAYALVTAFVFYILEYKMKIPAHDKSKKVYSPLQLLVRAIFAGTVVASAIIIASVGGSFWGGLFATFPAVLTSSMVILTMLQGSAFAQATGKVMMLSSSNIAVYGIGVYLTYPTLGLMWGTLISFGAAFLWVIILSPIIQKTT